MGRFTVVPPKFATADRPPPFGTIIPLLCNGRNPVARYFAYRKARFARALRSPFARRLRFPLTERKFSLTRRPAGYFSASSVMGAL